MYILLPDSYINEFMIHSCIYIHVFRFHVFYMLQLLMSVGARNMAKAYTALHCSSKETLSNVRCGYKECTKVCPSSMFV